MLIGGTKMSMPYKPPVNVEMARTADLPELLNRLKQDHEELLQVLAEMEIKAVQTEQETDRNRAMTGLLHLRLWTLGFKEELHRHSEWEERELFPLLHLNGQGHNPHSEASALDDLEKEHELAMHFMDTFLRAVHALKSDPEALSVKQTAEYLTFACRIYKNHLEQEEQLIFQ
jgi:iron-sulfur cluster repair protein YtfE (RIC family)